MVSRKNSDPPDKADDRDTLDVLDQDVLNVVFGSRGDHGIVASMAKSVGIGKVVKYRDRWRIDLGRAIEHTAGARYIYSMGPGAPFKKKAVAEAVLFRLRADIAKGGRTPEDVVLDYLPDGKQNLVLARMEKWLENLRRKERAGDRSGNYLRDIERWLKPEGYFRWWRGCSIHAVDEAAAEDFADWLAEQLVPRGKTKGKPLSAKTRRNILGAFRAFYRWAGRRDRRVRELRYFPWPEANEPDIQVITIAERDAIIAAIPEPKRGVYLALKLGAPRPNMAIEILTSDYDRKSRMLTLARARKGRTVDSQVGSTKTRVAWTIQANEELADWITKYVPKEAFLQGRLLFENPDAWNSRKAWSETRMRTLWYRACEKVMGRKVSLYAATKHTFATNAVAGGAAEVDVQRYLGHRDGKSLKRYVIAASQRFGTIQALGLVGPTGPKDDDTGTEGKGDD
jgi:site-specific recombinase XerD